MTTKHLLMTKRHLFMTTKHLFTTTRHLLTTPTLTKHLLTLARFLTFPDECSPGVPIQILWWGGDMSPPKMGGDPWRGQRLDGGEFMRDS